MLHLSAWWFPVGQGRWPPFASSSSWHTLISSSSSHPVSILFVFLSLPCPSYAYQPQCLEIDSTINLKYYKAFTRLSFSRFVVCLFCLARRKNAFTTHLKWEEGRMRERENRYKGNKYIYLYIIFKQTWKS